MINSDTMCMYVYGKDPVEKGKNDTDTAGVEKGELLD